MRRFASGESGTSMIEFAIILPFLVLLLIGTIEIGRFVYFGIVAAHAAEVGAVYGAQSFTNAGNSTGIQAAVTADAPNVSVSASPMPVCYQSGTKVTCPTGTPPAGTIEYIQVTVTGTFKSLLNYPGIPNNVPITASTMMRIMGQ